MEYLVSVVVPTKNRYKYLRYLIQLIDSFQLPELELVIQDNSDDNSEILEYLKGFDNPNIKYYYSSDSLTMSGNAELGIQNASGEYICYIGDDDGVCRNIVDCVRWMKENQIDVAVSRAAWFVWGGKIRIYDTNRPPTEVIYSDERRKRLAERGMVLYKSYMPNIYQSIVKKQVLVDIVAKYGTMFPSVPPDISGALVLSYAVKKYARINVPVVIAGSSAMTGGGVVKQGGVLPLDKVPFISADDIKNWEPCIPPIWCGNYAWLNSAIKTLRFIGHEELTEDINLEYGFAGAVARRPKKRVLWKYSFTYSKRKVRFCLIVILRIVTRYVDKVLENIGVNVTQSKGKATIIEAEEFFIDKNKKKFL